ncbi:hypothetical protein QJ854_gp105 [Moumouvirus goulette]|uniref:Uncharacterized protein n=1 Tax=Moumouvirus goulette TaxID=1247379 RepID=M1PY17_9VIRU|nr:hypothetical protein QJ854_gp105 [Moumouvirus goulette]AGF85677.1 hypothetical protein glt_00874 [Moumouvirus goulette]
MGNNISSRCKICLSYYKPNKKSKKKICSQCLLLNVDNVENEFNISSEQVEFYMEKIHRYPKNAYHLRPSYGVGFPIIH